MKHKADNCGLRVAGKESSEGRVANEGQLL